MRTIAVVLLGLLGSACNIGVGGTPPSPGVDASRSGTGGGGGGGGGGGSNNEALDAGAGGGSAAVCTGALYDPCTDNTQCMSQNCQAFAAQGIEVCTTTCTPGDDTPCAGGTCNMKGICKPPAANSCTPQ